MQLQEPLAEASTVANVRVHYITAWFILRSAVIVFDTLPGPRSGAEARARPGEIVPRSHTSHQSWVMPSGAVVISSLCSIGLSRSQR